MGYVCSWMRNHISALLISLMDLLLVLVDRNPFWACLIYVHMGNIEDRPGTFHLDCCILCHIFYNEYTTEDRNCCDTYGEVVVFKIQQNSTGNQWSCFRKEDTRGWQ